MVNMLSVQSDEISPDESLGHLIPVFCLSVCLSLLDFLIAPVNQVPGDCVWIQHLGKLMSDFLQNGKSWEYWKVLELGNTCFSPDLSCIFFSPFPYSSFYSNSLQISFSRLPPLHLPSFSFFQVQPIINMIICT